MDLMNMLIEARGGGLVKQVAEQVGLDERQASAAIAHLLPALADGVKNNIKQPGGLTGLLSAVQSGNHSRYVENPAEIADPRGVEDGKNILGHVLGSKDRSRAVAAEASQLTGIDVDKLKSMLPMIATMMMGGISAKAKETGIDRQPNVPTQSGPLDQLTGGGFGAVLGGLLDIRAPGGDSTAGKSGGVLGGLLGKFFK